MSPIKFQESPSNTITDILIKDQLIYVASWDCCVYVYDFYTQNLMYKIENEYPILKLAWNNDLIFSDANGFVNFITSNKLIASKINFNIKGISVLEPCKNSLIVGGFQNKICIFHSNGKNDLLDIKDKVYSSILVENDLILNFGHKVGMFDIRNFKQYKEIENKKHIRSICLNKDKLYIGDVDGKLKIHNCVTNEDVVINAHFEIRDDYKRIYPVNCILHDEYLFTCGSDGIVNRWKEEDKIKSRNIFKNKLGILTMASYDGRIVIGSGYNYEMGPADTSENYLFMI